MGIILSIILLELYAAVKVSSKAKLEVDEDAKPPQKKLQKPVDPPTSSSGRPATYIDLVVNPVRPKCPIVLDPKAAMRDMKKYETGAFDTQGPFVQANPFRLMNSKDSAYINYIFDYLDEMVIKKQNNEKLNIMLRKKFSETFEEAKKMKKTDIKYSNPYTAPKLLFYFSKGTAGEQPFTDPKLVDPKMVNSGAQATPSGMTPPTPANGVKPTPDDAPVPKAIYDAIISYNKNFDK